jgi:hypothetical protein
MRTNITLISIICLLFGLLATGTAYQSRDRLLPDPRLTPGDVLDVSLSDICEPDYTKSVRDVPTSERQQVYAEYGIHHHAPHAYEVDHLIPLELGGSNSIRNLWPESYLSQPWNAHIKDRLENELHRLVCSGRLNLHTAQQDIAADWIKAYKRYFKTDISSTHRQLPTVGSILDRLRLPRSNHADAHASRVWVNLNSGIYWRPGTRYYGKTENGKYMSEADARKQGYRAAK